MMALVSVSYVEGQTRYSYTPKRSDTDYYLERKYAESKKEKSNAHVGLLTRFGYSYNDDAFMYGASIYYHFDGILGISAGFDGYYMSKIYLMDEETGETHVSDKNYSLPMWDARAGFLLGKYLSFGAVLGKCKVCKPNSYHQKKNLWGANATEGIYGGYITFILPITSHVGINMDFALTNHTGFNIGAGINISMPIK